VFTSGFRRLENDNTLKNFVICRESQLSFKETSNNIGVEHVKVEEVNLWRSLLEEAKEGKTNNELVQKGGLVAAELKDIGGTKGTYGT